MSNLVWLKNTGGGFAAPITLATIANNGFSIADFNGDGKPDILYTLAGTPSDSLHILMNQGNGNFTDQVAGGLGGIVGQATVRYWHSEADAAGFWQAHLAKDQRPAAPQWFYLPRLRAPPGGIRTQEPKQKSANCLEAKRNARKPGYGSMGYFAK